MSASDGVIVWRNLFDISEKVCKQFGLRYGKIEPETNMRVHKYGEALPCDRCSSNKGVSDANCSEKIIKIRIHQLHRPNVPLSLRTIVDTLAHELAHLRPEAWVHGPKHTTFTKEILAFVREIGYTW